MKGKIVRWLYLNNRVNEQVVVAISKSIHDKIEGGRNG